MTRIKAAMSGCIQQIITNKYNSMSTPLIIIGLFSILTATAGLIFWLTIYYKNGKYKGEVSTNVAGRVTTTVYILFVLPSSLIMLYYLAISMKHLFWIIPVSFITTSIVAMVIASGTAFWNTLEQRFHDVLWGFGLSG
jgi:hypothetical protein